MARLVSDFFAHIHRETGVVVNEVNLTWTFEEDGISIKTVINVVETRNIAQDENEINETPDNIH